MGGRGTREDSIFIGLGDGGMPCMKSLRGRRASEIRMDGGRVRFNARSRFSGGMGARKAKARHLRQSVDPGVGAA